MTLLWGTLHFEIAFTFTAKRPCCSSIEVEIWAFWTSMKHLVLGGVTIDPAPFARAEDDMKRAQIEEINTFRL